MGQALPSKVTIIACPIQRIPGTLDKTTKWLKEALAYEFQDSDLLRQALTHRSAPGTSNERLEFLGDAVLQVTITEFVFRARAGAEEGQLSRLRSSLVKDSTLAEIATAIGLGDYILLGPGEKKSGGRRRNSILADTLEALFGAVFLDRGIEAAGRVIFRAFGERLVELPDTAELRDPKSRLQEWLQGRKIPLPVYQLEKTSGKAHRQTFQVKCEVPDLDATTSGQGSTLRDAEQQAAQLMLEIIERLR